MRNLARLMRIAHTVFRPSGLLYASFRHEGGLKGEGLSQGSMKQTLEEWSGQPKAQGLKRRHIAAVTIGNWYWIGAAALGQIALILMAESASARTTLLGPVSAASRS